MAFTVLWAFLAFSAYLGMTGIYVLAQASIGVAVGATVDVISIGHGPVVFERIWRNVAWRVSLFPYGGYTRFLGPDDEWNDSDFDTVRPVPFTELPAVSRIAILLSGPASSLLLGIILLSIAIYTSSPQLAVDSNLTVLVQPSGVPSLGFQQTPATWIGQVELFKATIVEFLINAVTLKGPSGWGSFVGWFVTAGASAVHSVGAWCSCVGLLCVANGLFSLLPIPVLNGGHIVFCLGELVCRNRTEQLRIPLTYLGLLILLAAFVYILVADVLWILAQVASR